MKKALLVIFLSFSISFSIAQSDETIKNKYTFPQIGWIFSAPDSFKLIDSSSTRLNPTTEIEIWRKQLMFTNNRNSLILSITKSSQKGIDWENIHKKEEKHFFDQSRIRQPSIQFDSLSTNLKIDSRIFAKFVVTGKENGKIVRNHVQLSSYINGYRFYIVYEFSDKEFQEQIEKSIMNGKFVY
mgnify:CR=1 FL=1